ncbi:MAG TPA: Rrf2 family transcriptional regulator, partial [Trueperaceae bacterium]|nr:Rrf2 family transcriptional regulator [Trueperaceae bacterium]
MPATIPPPVRTLLKREESYAVHAIIYAAENPGTPTATIARDLKMPPAFLAKVLRRMVEVGYLDNRTGRNGGVSLKVDPDTLTLLDIIQTVSGPLVLDTCQTHHRCATQQRKGYCSLNGVWVRATLAIHDVFAAVNIGSLIDRGAAGSSTRPKPEPVKDGAAG